MILFSTIDLIIILSFFSALILIGFYSGRKTKNSADDFLLSNRSLTLFLFVAVNVSTWYGGILGVGEFTYRFGLVSWVTQGLPYYIFALLFGIFFAKKIRETSLYTIPDKIEKVYGKNSSLLSGLVVFVLVSPAPYLLMTASLISLVFGLPILFSLILSLTVSLVYLITGGYRANIFTDVFQFFVMFIGFLIAVIYSFSNIGDINFIVNSVPSNHLALGGGMSPSYLIVWFLIALWTFADPGFHQRCYAAKDGGVARKGIMISILFWILFDLLTTTTGLFAKSVLPNLVNPVLSFPLFAEKVLPAGLKGIFFAALFATIISTQISFLFLSGTTISRDFIFRIKNDRDDTNLKSYTIIGLIISGLIAVGLAYLIPSVIEIWYTVGSIFIPAIILPVVSAYYPKWRISSKIIFIEMILAVLSSAFWYFFRETQIGILNEIEPMIIGLSIAVIVHSAGLLRKFFSFNQ
ncbi:MAG TPA: sodium:solute symporter family protein [Ignavibacteriaceae bacterium]|nr:sodium:solute symporter family protein [Ignavibacteriaceae bacterium]